MHTEGDPMKTSIDATTCPPWCTDHDDGDEDDPDWRGQHRRVRTFPLRWRGEVTIETVQDVGAGAAPYVLLNTGALGGCTPAQARVLAAALLDAADIAEAGA